MTTEVCEDSGIVYSMVAFGLNGLGCISKSYLGIFFPSLTEVTYTPEKAFNAAVGPSVIGSHAPPDYSPKRVSLTSSFMCKLT